VVEELIPKTFLASMVKEIRSKFWFFTFNNYANYPGYDTALRGLKNLSYLVYGHEMAPVTGTPHLQGYLEFSIRTKLSTLNGFKKIGLHCHWEVPKHYDTWKECRAYCIKDGGDVFEFGEGCYDKVLSKQKQAHGVGGKRTDIDDIRDAITAGIIHNTESLESFSGLTYQGMLYADRVLRNARPVRECSPDIYYIHGKTGIGKSRYGRELIGGLERGRDWRFWESYDNRLKWFDGYDKHEIALFDDFRGSDCHFPTLLRITDRYVCRVEVKGASAWWCPRVIIFTSSQSLSAAFGHLGSNERADQFERRVRAEGGGGEFDFNDPEQLRAFRERIDVYAVPVCSFPEVPSPITSDSGPSVEVEAGAEESKSEEVVCGGGVSPLWNEFGDMSLFGNDLLNDSLSVFADGFNP